MRPDPERLPASLPVAMAPLMQADPSLVPCASSRGCWRIARGGRLMLTRVHGLTGERLAEAGQPAAPAPKPLGGAASLVAPPPHHMRLGALVEWWAEDSCDDGAGSVRLSADAATAVAAEEPTTAATGDTTGAPAAGAAARLAASAPWASGLDLSQLPMCVDGEMLLRRRTHQLAQHHMETSQLGSLAGERKRHALVTAQPPRILVSTHSYVHSSVHPAIHPTFNMDGWMDG
eukprot:356902-Chlamydomonas_euryale.AAC.14